jgi:hypothetical protein
MRAVTPLDQERRRNPPIALSHASESFEVVVRRTGDKSCSVAIESEAKPHPLLYSAKNAPLSVLEPLRVCLASDFDRVKATEREDSLLRVIECIAIAKRKPVRSQAQITHSATLYTDLSRALEDFIEKKGVRGMASMMTLTEITPKIIQVHFPVRALACAVMLRFQEHYESPFFRGKTFTRGEFRAWYPSNSSPVNEFSYYFDWSGFNFPSKTLEAFTSGGFRSLHSGERALLGLLKPYQARGDFYVIGTSGDASVARNRDTIDHEIRHGLFSTDKIYRRESLRIIKGANLSPIRRFLKDSGYHPSVFRDEYQAYLGGDLRELSERVGGGFDASVYQAEHDALSKLQEERLKAQRG